MLPGMTTKHRKDDAPETAHDTADVRDARVGAAREPAPHAHAHAPEGPPAKPAAPPPAKRDAARKGPPTPHRGGTRQAALAGK